jgi:hypothetical protein
MEFRCIKRSTEYQADESKKDQSVHYTRIDISECLNLKQAIRKKQLNSFRDLVIPDFRFAQGGPHLPPSVNAVSKNGQGDSSKGKKESLKILSIPENLSPFVAD